MSPSPGRKGKRLLKSLSLLANLLSMRYDSVDGQDLMERIISCLSEEVGEAPPNMKSAAHSPTPPPTAIRHNINPGYSPSPGQTNLSHTETHREERGSLFSPISSCTITKCARTATATNAWLSASGPFSAALSPDCSYIWIWHTTSPIVWCTETHYSIFLIRQRERVCQSETGVV